MTLAKSYSDLKFLTSDECQFIDNLLNPLDLDMISETIMNKDFGSLFKYKSFDFKFLIETNLFYFLIVHANYPAIKHVILHGTNINAQDEYGRSAIHYVCMYSSATIISLMAKQNANLMQYDNFKVSAIGYAYYRQNYAITKFINEYMKKNRNNLNN